MKLSLYVALFLLCACSPTPPSRYFYAIDVGASETTVSKMTFKGSSAYGIIEATYPNGAPSPTTRLQLCGYFSGPVKSITVEADGKLFWLNTAQAFNFKPSVNSPSLNYQEEHPQKALINSVLEPIEPNCT